MASGNDRVVNDPPDGTTNGGILDFQVSSTCCKCDTSKIMFNDIC